MNEYTREQLISICEKSIVPEDKWSDRDSFVAHEQIGTAWILLKAGCDFSILTEGSLITDADTIWLEIHYKGFMTFEYDNDGKETLQFYLPTEQRLESRAGGDWY